MFIESISSYANVIKEYEESCRDSLSAGIAGSLQNAVASMLSLERTSEASKRQLAESIEKGMALDQRKASVMSRVARFLPSGVTYRGREGLSVPVSVGVLGATSIRIQGGDSSVNVSRADLQSGNKVMPSESKSNKEHKEYVMNENDRKTRDKNSLAFSTIQALEKALGKANSLVASIEIGRSNLVVLDESVSRMNGMRMVESQEVLNLEARERAINEVIMPTEEVLRELDAVQRRLQVVAEDTRNIGSVMDSVCLRMEEYQKKWRGFSGAVKKVINRSAFVKSRSQKDKTRISALVKQIGEMIYEAKAIIRDSGAFQKTLASEVHDAVERKSARESLAITVLNKTKDVSALLATLSGRPESDFISYMRIEDGKQLPVLSQESDAPRVFSKAMTDMANAIEDMSVKCRDCQPPVGVLAEENINLSVLFPPYVIYGDAETSALGEKLLRIPMASAFPFKSSFVFDDPAAVALFLIRLLYALPAGNLSISAIDHKDVGDNIGPLNALCNAGILRIVTSSDDISAILREYEDLMGNMVRNGILSAKESDWAAYNANHPEQALPFRVLAIYSMSGFTPAQLDTLHKILSNGLRFGIMCLLVADAKNDLDERLRKRHEELLKGIELVRIGVNGGRLDGFKHLQLSISDADVDIKREGELIDRYLATYNDIRATPVREIAFKSLFENVDFWGQSTEEGISASVGWDVLGNPVDFEFGVGRGASAYHALIGGTTGSGKSVFLHTLIQSLSYRYSPDELELYLLDYKKGDEFKKYADMNGNAWLPHVKMISRHKDPRFALELFDFLDREFKRRSECFGSYGDIVAFRKNGGKIPRIVIVIDEFQVMFEEYYGLNLSEEVAKRLSTVFRQGRSYGIHIVLATQSLASLHFSGMSGILGQIGLRIALKGTANDGILADGNRSAESIIPKQQCIVNTAFGAKDSDGVSNNVVTNVPFSDPAQVDECKKFRTEIEKAAATAGKKVSCRVFNGAELPGLPEEGDVAEALKPLKWNTLFTLLAGARTDFASSPFPVAFSEMQREHLLIAGEDGNLSPDFEVRISGEDVWDGLRRGIVRSLAHLDSCKVLYYNPGVGELPEGIPDEFIGLTGRASDVELMDAFKALEAFECKRKIVMVENFQEARLLHPGDAPRPSFQTRPSEPVEETTASVFASLFNGTANPKFHAIVMTKNFSFMNKEVLARSGAETNILKGCGKRIAFNLSDDDLGVMIPHLKTQDRRGPRRVWFEDMSNGQVVDFLPYGN